MPPIQTQISRYIGNLRASSSARLLAQELLLHSVRFVYGLVEFITRSHAELKAVSTYSKGQIWSLVCQCVKRVFQDLSDARVTGRDAKDSEDELQTAAEYLWATLKTHMIMAE